MRQTLALVILALALPTAEAIDVPAPLAGHLPLDAVEIMGFGPLDRGWLAVDDAAREAQGLAPRYAVQHAVRLTPQTSGTWEELTGGRRLWRLRVRAEAAASLNLGFTRFRLPAGAQLQIYSADLAHVVRPFTSEDNEEHGELWTPVVPTDDLVVALILPSSARGGSELELGHIGQGYRGFGFLAANSVKSGSCNMDVACLDSSDPWRQTARAVGVISLDGGTFCSGSLVNNTAQDRKMFFITAQHCGISSSNAASLVVYWNYQSSTCRTPGSPASAGIGDGLLNQFHTGSFFRAASSASDFTLVELDDPPVAAFNHHWAGWDRSSGDVSCPQGNCYECSATSLCASIHHPGTDEKRITFAEQAIQPSNGGNLLWVHWDPTPVFPPNPGLTIPPQVTEPGSSGSPLYNKDRRFVGQLQGGPSACGQTGDGLSDFYGRFSVSWSVAAPHLDPGDTGELFIDGRDNFVPIFSDGFESGTAAAWGLIVP